VLPRRLEAAKARVAAKRDQEVALQQRYKARTSSTRMLSKLLFTWIKFHEQEVKLMKESQCRNQVIASVSSWTKRNFRPTFC
jgi:hypothetical protein